MAKSKSKSSGFQLNGMHLLIIGGVLLVGAKVFIHMRLAHSNNDQAYYAANY